MKKIIYITLAVALCAGIANVYANSYSSKETTPTEQVKIKRKCKNCDDGYIKQGESYEKCPVCKGTGWIQVK